MSKVPNFKTNYNILLERIHNTKEHDPSSSQFELNLTEMKKSWYSDIIHDQNIYTKEEIENIKKIYNERLQTTAKMHLYKQIKACKKLNNDTTLDLNQMANHAFNTLSLKLQDIFQSTIKLRIVELLIQNEETLWKAIEYQYPEIEYHFDFGLVYPMITLEELAKCTAPEPLKQQFKSVYEFFTFCFENLLPLCPKRLLPAKDLENIPDNIHTILSQVCYKKLMSDTPYIRLCTDNTARELLSHKTVHQLLTQKQLNELKTFYLIKKE